MFMMQQMAFVGLNDGDGGSSWNSADKTDGVLSNSNRTWTQGAGVGGAHFSAIRSTTFKNVGKWYFEYRIDTSDGLETSIGVADGTSTLISAPGTIGIDNHNGGYNSSTGALRAGSFATNVSVAAAAAGDVIGVAIDVPNHVIWVAKNGTWLNSGFPGSIGVGSVDIVTTSPVFAYAVFRNNGPPPGVGTINFGGSAFANAVPAGFTAWG